MACSFCHPECERSEDRRTSLRGTNVPDAIILIRERFPRLSYSAEVGRTPALRQGTSEQWTRAPVSEVLRSSLRSHSG